MPAAKAVIDNFALREPDSAVFTGYKEFVAVLANSPFEFKRQFCLCFH